MNFIRYRDPKTKEGRLRVLKMKLVVYWLKGEWK